MGKFFWGAATSSHQVEGGNTNDWTAWEAGNAAKLASEARNKSWPDFVLKKHPNPLEKENYISGRACDHYNLYEEDFDIAKRLGHNAHRFSAEWSRIEPQEGKFNQKEIEHYRKVINALKGRGLEPLATIWHWTLPLWLREKGGVLNENFSAYFERYVQKLAYELKKDVRFWITINEPEIYSMNSYLRGKWPPQKRNLFSFLKCRAQLISAHKRARAAIKRVTPNAQTGASLNLAYFESGGGIINNLLKWGTDKFWNFYFLNRVHEELDFIGLNYYFHNRINYGFNKHENKEVSDMGWEIYPVGLYEVLKGLKKYNLPIYITENGLADARDALRGKFIKDHLFYVKKAMDEGADVRGYFHWSLLDNFEWDKGFWPRFGLVGVDYSAKGACPSEAGRRRGPASGGKILERKIRPSALEYKKLIERWPKL